MAAHHTDKSVLQPTAIGPLDSCCMAGAARCDMPWLSVITNGRLAYLLVSAVVKIVPAHSAVLASVTTNRPLLTLVCDVTGCWMARNARGGVPYPLVRTASLLFRPDPPRARPGLDAPVSDCLYDQTTYRTRTRGTGPTRDSSVISSLSLATLAPGVWRGISVHKTSCPLSTPGDQAQKCACVPIRIGIASTASH